MSSINMVVRALVDGKQKNLSPAVAKVPTDSTAVIAGRVNKSGESSTVARKAIYKTLTVRIRSSDRIDAVRSVNEPPHSAVGPGV
jgi:hypothetical protein